MDFHDTERYASFRPFDQTPRAPTSPSYRRRRRRMQFVPDDIFHRNFDCFVAIDDMLQAPYSLHTCRELLDVLGDYTFVDKDKHYAAYLVALGVTRFCLAFPDDRGVDVLRATTIGRLEDMKTKAVPVVAKKLAALLAELTTQ